ncbi:MAG: chromosomal replication initiator protein DnaA [Thermodesulfobacterium sp.]|nr:chromosomal replication initiator protein DnaA [Thermodesulfobacterium sp.]
MRKGKGELNWERIKGKIRELVSENIFKVWFEPLKGKIVGKKLILEVPNDFSKIWIKENYSEVINIALKGFNLDGYEFLVQEGDKIDKRAEQLYIPYNPISLIGRKLAPKYTFEEFVTGKCNELAYNVCYQIAEEVPKGYLIYLYGNFGLGKTHLTQAVGNKLLERGFSKVYYLTAQDFLNYMIKYLRSGMIESFKEKIREHCEVLLLEGIHFFSGKEYTQNELALLLDYFIDSGKTVIFTSLKLPQELPKMDSSLKSRLSCGLIIKLGNPDFQTRKKILRHKAKKLGYTFPYEVVEFLARSLRGDVRQLESAVLGLIARASLCKEPISLELAKELVTEMGISKEEDPKVEIIIDTACRFWGVSREDLLSSSRKKNLTLYRQVIIYCLKKLAQKSVKEIGNLLKKEHSTIIYSLKALEKKLSQSSEIKLKLEFLIKEIKNEISEEREVQNS